MESESLQSAGVAARVFAAGGIGFRKAVQDHTPVGSGRVSGLVVESTSCRSYRWEKWEEEERRSRRR